MNDTQDIEEEDLRIDIEGEAEKLLESDEVKQIYADIDKVIADGGLDQEPEEDKDEEVETSEPEKEEPKEEKDIFAEVLKEEEGKLEKKGDQAWKHKKRMFQAQAALDKERAENDRLKVLLKDALDAAAYNHGQNIEINLMKAAADKKTALDEQDQAKFLKADYDLNQAQLAKHEYEKWKREEEYRLAQLANTPQVNQTENVADPYEEEYNRKIVSRWIKKHPYLHTESDDYDEDLADRVSLFTHKLNKKLEESDRVDQYLSKDYFDTVDEYISNNLNRTKAPSPLKTSANTNRVPVGTVRNSAPMSGGSNNNTIKITLTTDEKMMGVRAGLTEKELIMHKTKLLEAAKENKQARG